MQVTPLNDQQLITSYLEGNEKAFEELLSRHKAKIYTQIYLFVKDTALAEDIFQEVFIKIIDTLRKGKYNHANSNTSSWSPLSPTSWAGPT